MKRNNKEEKNKEQKGKGALSELAVISGKSRI
jgi:hypothetical protein